MSPETAKNPPQHMRIETIEVQGRALRAAVRPGTGVPLLLFNGIGANLELTFPFVEALTHTEAIAFDVPGIGGSETPLLPPRMSGYARVASDMLKALGYTGQVDVAGVSWGGVLAQQFARQYQDRVRRLVLAATSPGQLMFPGRVSALRRMATPKRYISSSYMAKAGPFIYGGLVRQKPELIGRHASLIRRPSSRGYLYQLMAGYGFTSLPWLYRLRMHTLIMAGDDDPIMPLANARLLQFLIPKSRLHVVRDGGHLFLVTRAHESASVIERFLGAAHPDESSGQGTQAAP